MQQIETLYLPNLKRKDDQQDLYLVQRIDIDDNGSDKPTMVPLTQLDSLSRVNILVGANNSGKSRFMRLLAMEEGLNINSSVFNIDKLTNSITKLLDNIKICLNTNGYKKLNDITPKLIDIEIENIPKYISTHENAFERLYKFIKNISEFTYVYSREVQHVYTDENTVMRRIVQYAQQGIPFFEELYRNIDVKNPKKFYLPTLRGLRPLNSNYDDFYKQQTIDSYFKDTEHKPEVFTGLGLYTELRSYLLGDNAKRKKIKEYQEFISRSLFEGKEVTLIPSEEQKIVVVKIGNELERPIHELGDGIQSAIILTFLPFVSLENCIFFIEEPELFLHPSMQRKILEFYHSLDRHLFFMTTHSNHLLDITIDIPEISIYSFRKSITSSDDDQTPQFVVENVDNNQSSSLELLGVRNSSVLLVNATIWVEGITDRWYLREMLRMYMESRKDLKQFVEDMHYMFVEYGGGNITHFSFVAMEDKLITVERLCAKAFVIIDQDGDAKLKRKDELKAKLGDRLIILPCREIENSLPPEVISSVVIDYEKSTQNPNPEINSFAYTDYQNESLGEFIEEHVIKSEKHRRGSYKADSGTITDKLGFCTKALAHLKNLTFDQLPSTIQAEIKKLYEFILAQNSI